MLQRIKPYSKYVLDAIRSIKASLDADPMRYKTATELLEKVCDPNRNTVEQAFKALYGAGIKEYQVRQRLELSKKYLECGFTKKQVASKCCYKSASAYAAAFKKHFRMTPTRWQELYS